MSHSHSLQMSSIFGASTHYTVVERQHNERNEFQCKIANEIHTIHVIHLHNLHKRIKLEQSAIVSVSRALHFFLFSFHLQLP